MEPKYMKLRDSFSVIKLVIEKQRFKLRQVEARIHLPNLTPVELSILDLQIELIQPWLPGGKIEVQEGSSNLLKVN